MGFQNVNTAIYCRLSRDDGSVDDSQSIQSQKDILTEYVKQQDWKLFDYYIDDGYSGTDFNRPAFQRLLRDIELDRIDIVVTKDLSRLGRNYIQTGYYTEEYFPLHNIRYVAVNDNFDTFKEDNNDFVPFKNIINEWYAKDISKKIRFTLDNKAKNGEARNTVFPIFGYTYNDSYERIPDPETAPIVKLIYEEYVKLGSSTKVVHLLKDRKIKIPSYYNAVKYGYNKKKIMEMSEDKLITWGTDVIRDIIRKNDYLGTYTTAKSKSTSYKMKKRVDNENAYVFENRYEPLIDKDTWEKANKILKRSRAGTIPMNENEYKGLIICANCGRIMKYDRKKDKNTKEFNFFRYYCAKKNCSHINGIQKKYLNTLVSQELLSLKKVILSNKETFLEFVTNYDDKGRNVETDLGKEIKIYQKKSEDLDYYIMQLFEHNLEGIIPHSTFEMMMNKYNKEKKFIDEQLKELTKIQGQQLIKESNEEKAKILIDLLESLDYKNVLSTDVIHSMIDGIIVSSIPMEKSSKKHIYDVVIVFAVLDVIIKEYIKTYEEIWSNLC